MKKSIYIIILIAIIIGNAFAGNEDLFKEANNLYKSGLYKEAIEKYQKIYEQGFHSAELYYNMGNSYYKNGEHPKAILFYEKSKLLAPTDKDIDNNLMLANSKIIDKIPTIEAFFLYKWVKSVRDLFSSGSWSVIFIILIWISSVIFIVKLKLKNNSAKHQILKVLGAIFIIISILSLSAGIYRLKAENSRNTAIVISPSIDLKTSLDPAAEIGFTLHEGTKILILEFKDNMYKIKISDGREAWIPSSAIEII